jgi:hypothetical protein
LSNVDRRKEARERVDDRQRANLAAVERLIVREAHRPRFVRSAGAGAATGRIHLCLEQC